MLVLSDMSGPSMQPGFDEYLTGYPLIGTEHFVFAKTWYAGEMRRPGCVWTHSLLVPRAQVGSVSATRLLAHLRRPEAEGVDAAASLPLTIDLEVPAPGGVDEGFADRGLAAALIGAVLGQTRPVLVVADSASQFEALFLRLWEEMWSAARARFSFCTGALMPRVNAGSLLDLQAVPRAIPTSQFRKSASAALVLELRASSEPEAWVESVLDALARRDGSFRGWIEATVGTAAGPALVPSVAPLFGDWCAPTWSAESFLASVLTSDVDQTVRNRLVSMLFDRVITESGTPAARELLQYLCRPRDIDLAPIASMLEDQARRIFERSRAEGIAALLALLGGELTDVGGRVLRAAVLLLEPRDLERFGEAQVPFLPTIVGVNPRLASSPALWSRIGGRSAELLSQLATIAMTDEERGAVVEAIICSGCDVSVDGLIRVGGKTATFRGLKALSAGQIPLSWQWRSALSGQLDAVVEWLESLLTPSTRDLELGSRFVTPRTMPSRLATAWKRGTSSDTTVAPRVAAFGLALALWEGSATSRLLAVCFQATYDAAAASRLEYDEWDWLREHAPPVSWWRDWDKCERLAAAVARLLDKQKAPLETVFEIVRDAEAMRKVAAVLDDGRDSRAYLKLLRRAVESSSIGTRGQREALGEK
jgi:hypothetical protein